MSASQSGTLLVLVIFSSYSQIKNETLTDTIEPFFVIYFKSEWTILRRKEFCVCSYNKFYVNAMLLKVQNLLKNP